jgi:hypothetical protein
VLGIDHLTDEHFNRTPKTNLYGYFTAHCLHRGRPES